MLPLLLLACSSGTACDALGDGPEVTDVAVLLDVLQETRELGYPELAGVEIQLRPLQSTSDTFFLANVDLSTLGNEPLERTYAVFYSPEYFADPASRAATAAILMHELKHILDYTEMSREQLVEFGLWYATADIADYEHETDEAALERGCALGLIGYREWVYAHIPEEDVAEKRRIYYTPEEIEAWVAANP